VIEVGTTIDGKYRVQKLLGAGAMGEVYAAEHAATGRRVAVKLISSPELIRDTNIISRFQREARVAGGIDTQYITQVLDAGVDPTSALPFLVMEYLNGEDLQVLLKRIGPLFPDTALRIVAQACLGLQKAHEAGVVHRDIKPANLFLARRDAGEVVVKLLDFGIAKVKMDRANDTENAGLTKTGSMLGSPLYMSPEQARGEAKHIDHRTDLWSLGVVLYQCLCGRSPYEHVTALGQLILAICSEWPRHIQEAAPWVPPEVASIVHRCLQHNPAERWPSAVAMFNAIRSVLPNGWTITDDLLVPINEAARGATAEKFALTTALAGVSTAVITGIAGQGHAGAGTDGALSHSQSRSLPPPRQTNVLGVGIGIASVAAVAVAGTYFAMHSRPHERGIPMPDPVEAALPSATSTVSAPPQGVLAPSSAAPGLGSAVGVVPVAALSSPRRVKVVVMPADATVEIEGQPVSAKNGLVEITGTLGSVHRVRVSKGKHESTTDVIVTEDGPSPPKVELVSATAKPTAAVTAIPPAAPAPATRPGIVNQFE
jgi:serine/threonine-protein kinase